MRWPQIAACLRHELHVSSERQGVLLGEWKDPRVGETLAFQAAYERGGTKLALIVEIGDIDVFDAKVAQAIRKGIPPGSTSARPAPSGASGGALFAPQQVKTVSQAEGEEPFQIFLAGRIVGMRHQLDVLTLSRATLETSVRALLTRATRLRQGTVPVSAVA